jgi:hypothetical protein
MRKRAVGCHIFVYSNPFHDALDQGYIIVQPGKPELFVKDDFVDKEVKMCSFLVSCQVMLGQADNV